MIPTNIITKTNTPCRKLPKCKEPIRLNLGCGTQKEKDWIGVDYRDMGQEIIWDLREGLPFPDESVEEIYSCHFLEHLGEEETINLLCEMFRILKKGKDTRHRLPHQQHPTAYYVGHKSFWNEEKVEALIRVPGLNFEILQNKRIGNDLYFVLRKK